jgi:hypothetical protein
MIKAIGAPMTTIQQVAQFLGRPCSSGYLDPGGVLLPGPLHTVVPSCTDGSDKQGSTPNTIPKCPQGQIYDLTLSQCVPTADPYGCGDKCSPHAAMSASWAQCLLQCNAEGANVAVTKPPKPEPIVDPVDEVEPTASDVFGGNLPIIVGALAVGVSAAVYFATKKKPAQTTALANRKKRRKRKRSKGRR